MSTFEKVTNVMVNSLKIDSGKIVESASFKDDLGLDSLEQAELIMEFEKTFNCEIPEEVAEQIITVGDAVKYLDSIE
ncbi:MAG: acyl carrier protein [Holosporales bacterium]|nr:acyl carrier protein [Holosporales bacterium]